MSPKPGFARREAPQRCACAASKEGARGGTMGSPAIKHAPSAVEDEDSLGEELVELCAGVLHEVDSRLKRSGAGKALWLFRRLITRSPSCRSKLSGVASG